MRRKNSRANSHFWTKCINQQQHVIHDARQHPSNLRFHDNHLSVNDTTGPQHDEKHLEVIQIVHFRESSTLETRTTEHSHRPTRRIPRRRTASQRHLPQSRTPPPDRAIGMKARTRMKCGPCARWGDPAIGTKTRVRMSLLREVARLPHERRDARPVRASAPRATRAPPFKSSIFARLTAPARGFSLVPESSAAASTCMRFSTSSMMREHSFSSASESTPTMQRTALYFKSCSRLAQKSIAMVRIWISTGISSFESRKYTGSSR